jgi:hypothetical protein
MNNCRHATTGARTRASTGATIGAILGALAAITAAAPAAEARLLDLHAAAQAGAIGGWGTTSRPDFFDHTRGPAFGAEVGLKLLVFDLSASFTQVIDSSGWAGTLTQAGLAIDVDIPVGPTRLPNGQSAHVIHPSIGVNFGFGTPGPVNPPLNAAQISDKGVLFPARVGYEYFLNPFVAVGAEAMFGYHYFFVDGALDNHSQGFQLAALGTVKFHLGI